MGYHTRSGIQRLLTAARDLTAATTLTGDEQFGNFFLNSATEFAVTLPTPFKGAEYNFYVKAAPSGADYTIVSSSANIVGHIVTSDVNSATDADFEATGATTITLVASKAVKGDRVQLVSDGTNWYATAFTSVFDAVTISGT
jgi:hypothetical protein